MNNKLYVLSKEEEIRLANLAKNGDKEARRLLIEHNIRLAGWVAYRMSYVAPDARTSDLFSSATQGLIEAVDKFNPANGNRLAAYAVHHMLLRMRGERRDYRYVTAGDLSMIEDYRNWSTKSKNEEDPIAVVELLLNSLSTREQEIIRLRFGLDGKKPMKYKEIAKVMGMSISGVHESVIRSIKKMGSRRNQEGKT